MNKSEILRELALCKVDPIYFIKNYSKIEEPGNTIQMEPYPKQIEFVNSILNDHYVISLKSRQIGISTITQAFAVYVTTFFSNITVGIISRDGPEATDFTRKCRIMYEGLPLWMQRKFIKKTEQSYELNNNSRIISSTVNQANPSSVFRGKTITLLIIDEAAFIRNISIAFTGITPSVIKAHQVALKKSIPHGIVVLSTPNKTYGIGKWFYDSWTKAKTGNSIFKPIKIHYSDAPFADEEWVEKQRKIILSIGTMDDVEQELELKFIVGDDALFEKETFNKLQDIINNDDIAIKEEEKVYPRNNGFGKGKWIYFKEIKEDDILLLGIDVATSYGACNSAIEVTDTKLEQVAEFVGKFRVMDLEDEIIDFMTKHKNAYLIIEANSYATELVERLDENPEISSRMFYRKIYDKKTKKIKDIQPGVMTDNSTRPKMITAMYNVVEENPDRIKSKYLADELMSINKDKKSNKLSDRAMSYSFICYVYEYFKEELPIEIMSKKEREDSFKQFSKLASENMNKHEQLKKSFLDNKLKNRNLDNISDEEFENFMFGGSDAITKDESEIVQIIPLNGI